MLGERSRAPLELDLAPSVVVRDRRAPTSVRPVGRLGLPQAQGAGGRVTLFEPGGPVRFGHQKRGLEKMIRTHGVTALLMDPGLGKSAIVLDYAGLLALKSATGEARVLVVCPLVAVDTWVLQAATFMSPQVGYWAEALSGTLLERAEALAARGGNPYARSLSRRRPTPPRGWIQVKETGQHMAHRATCLKCGAGQQAVRASTVDCWWQQHLKDRHPERVANRITPHAPRALHHDRSILIDYRQPAAEQGRLMSAPQGPGGLWRPRVVLEVLNLDTFAQRAHVGSQTMADVMLESIKRFAPDLVVVDESHKIKAVTGNASLLMARVGRQVKRRVILTGTVTPAGPLDVFAQWRFLDPYAFGQDDAHGVRQPATFEEYKSRYVVYGGWDSKEIKGYVNLDHMKEVMARNAVVARKNEALDLPPTTEVELRVDLSTAELTAYREMKKQLATKLVNGAMASVTSRLTQMLRLRQITSGHLPVDGGGAPQVIGTSKVDMIKSLVQDTLIGEKRIVIFCLFSLEIKMLAEALAKDPGTKVMVIEGSTGQDDRQAMRAAFGNVEANPQRMVLVCQIKTMSLAINELVTASHAIFASLSQQRDDIEQAKARLDRQGQTRPVTFWYCNAPGTVDQVILQSHRDRTDLENALLQHLSNTD